MRPGGGHKNLKTNLNFKIYCFRQCALLHIMFIPNKKMSNYLNQRRIVDDEINYIYLTNNNSNIVTNLKLKFIALNKILYLVIIAK